VSEQQGEGAQPSSHQPPGPEPPPYQPPPPGYSPPVERGPAFIPPGGPPPYGAPGYPPPAPPPPATSARRSPVRTILIIVSALLALCCIGSVVTLAINGTKIVNSVRNPPAPKVGACMGGDSLASQTPDQFKEVNLREVNCTATNANYKVVGRIDNKTQAEANVRTICAPFTTAEFVYWEGQPGKPGTVLCLAPNKK
jgi:hypothetical protein